MKEKLDEVDQLNKLKSNLDNKITRLQLKVNEVATLELKIQELQ